MTVKPLDPDACPGCGAERIEWTVHEPALIRHGGYGATRRTVGAVCRECDWSLVREVSEVWP